MSKLQLKSSKFFSSLNEKTGFTLVELMVVISIIAILATIGLTIYTQAQIAARDARRQGDILETQKALEQYYAVNQAYPVAGGTVSGITGVNNSFPTYFQSGTPPDDPNLALVGNYHYTLYKCATAEKYVVCAKLESSGGKANRGAVPTTGCESAADTQTPAIYYCASSLSN